MDDSFQLNYEEKYTNGQSENYIYSQTFFCKIMLVSESKGIQKFHSHEI